MLEMGISVCSANHLKAVEIIAHQRSFLLSINTLPYFIPDERRRCYTYNQSSTCLDTMPEGVKQHADSCVSETHQPSSEGGIQAFNQRSTTPLKAVIG